ncbi:divalent-cation tolerance protein CutA [Pyruvatibacter sp.]|uniref:divalent-cation tolerance protein CutA n=1 Tax=Pyruvatibacter sp. TaxID=1981328 RepID=UPI0032EC59CB
MSGMANADKVVFIYTTVASMDAADAIADTLVGARLAACANIVPGMQSVYRWNGQIAREQEIVVILKTRKGLEREAIKAVCAVHPYDVPAVTAFAASSVSGDFAAWIGAETSLDHDESARAEKAKHTDQE